MSSEWHVEEIWLTLEQYIFEMHRSTYRWNLINKYSTRIFILQILIKCGEMFVID